jgi:hypothetical protein
MYDSLFFQFLTLYTLGGVTFSLLICFQQLSVRQMHQEKGFNFCLDIRNKGALPSDLAFPACLSARSSAGLP